MATASTVQTTIAPDAAARVQELGLEQEFKMMREQLPRIIPDLRAIEVSLDYPPDYDDDPMVTLITYQPEYSGEGLEPTDREYDLWLIKTFGPDVLRHFVRLIIYETPNER
jgi:hypothetical protein